MYMLHWFQMYKLSFATEEKWRLMCWTLARKAEQWGGDIDSHFIQECGFLVVSYQKRILLLQRFWSTFRSKKKKKKSVIHIISAICMIKRNSVRTFSLSWEMTRVCWNHLAEHKWTCRNKRKRIKEQTVCSRSSVCLDLYKAFDGTSKVSVEM